MRWAICSSLSFFLVHFLQPIQALQFNHTPKHSLSFRKSWDKEYYEARAKARVEGAIGGDEAGDEEKKIKSRKEEFQKAEEGAAGPMGSQRAFLKAREQRVDLDSKAGKTELYTPNAAVDGKGGIDL